MKIFINWLNNKNIKRFIEQESGDVLPMRQTESPIERAKRLIKQAKERQSVSSNTATTQGLKNPATTSAQPTAPQTSQGTKQADVISDEDIKKLSVKKIVEDLFPDKKDNKYRDEVLKRYIDGYNEGAEKLSNYDAYFLIKNILSGNVHESFLSKSQAEHLLKRKDFFQGARNDWQRIEEIRSTTVSDIYNNDDINKKNESLGEYINFKGGTNKLDNYDIFWLTYGILDKKFNSSFLSSEQAKEFLKRRNLSPETKYYLQIMSGSNAPMPQSGAK